MLGLKISKTDWEKLTPALQEVYSAEGDNYVLDVEAGGSDDSAGELRRALDRTKADLKAERKARRESEAKLTDIDTVDAQKRGDIKKLQEQWDAKEAASSTAHAEEVAKLRDHIRSTSIDSVVSGVAGRNTGTKENAALLDPHIRQQLSVEFTDDGPRIMMAADDGAVPLDVDKFEKTVVDNPAFAAIIVGNKASGGGATGNDNSGQTGGAFPTDTQGQSEGPLDLSTADPVHLAKILSK